MNLSCCKSKKSITELKKVVDFLEIISEENRFKILCLLKNGKKCVCDICQCLKLPQNLASHHLKVLKDFGLISSKKVGLKVFYKLNQKVVKKKLKELNKVLNK
jgi:ArsR family transcriptional regulator